jgi:hypothetical protein
LQELEGGVQLVLEDDGLRFAHRHVGVVHVLHQHLLRPTEAVRTIPTPLRGERTHGGRTTGSVGVANVSCVYRTTTLPLRVSRVASGAAEVVASSKASAASTRRKDGAIVKQNKTQLGRREHTCGQMTTTCDDEHKRKRDTKQNKTKTKTKKQSKRELIPTSILHEFYRLGLRLPKPSRSANVRRMVLE